MTGTNPLAPLAVLLDDAMTVSHIAAESVWTLDPSDPADEMALALAARDFDLAATGADNATHFVRRAALEGAPPGATVADCAEPIVASMCVESSLALGKLFDKLVDVEFVFVLADDRVQHVVTRADLQAPVVGVVVLAYLTAIETGIKTLVLHAVGDEFFEMLSPERRAKVEELYDRKHEANVATGLEDCLYFTDWMTVAMASRRVLDRLGADSNSRLRREVGCFAELRNDLAHGRSVLDAAAPLNALDRIRRVRSFAARVWRAVERFDPVWDEYASTVVTLADGSVLVGSGAALLPARPIVHVLTAWNPSSRRRSLHVNREANDCLEDALRRDGVPTWRAVGSGPDDRWFEESIVVGGLTRGRACELGRTFGQVAVFEVDEASLRVLACSDGTEVCTRARGWTDEAPNDFTHVRHMPVGLDDAAAARP